MTAELSVVIPVFNGALSVGHVVDDIVRELKDDLCEVILVNDGSQDKSAEVCLALVDSHKPRVIYVELSKNFSEHNAVMAGLHHVTGKYVVIMDDDNQNPVSEVRKLLAEIRKGFDVVYSYYAVKQHNWLRNLGSWFNDAVACFMLDKPRDLYLSSFKILNRFVVDELIRYANPYPYIDGLILQTTDRIGKVQVEHKKREHGRSNYSIRKLIRLWMNMFVNFSILPLRLAGFLGFLITMVGFILGVHAVIEKMYNPELPLGYTSLIVSILVIGGIQCLLLGMIGEYLGRALLSINQRPQFVTRRVCGGMKIPGAKDTAGAGREDSSRVHGKPA
jgi:undecaprenyl-phosphate 4-deoxy-4-formamido-L-arabinose transferase